MCFVRSKTNDLRNLEISTITKTRLIGTISTVQKPYVTLRMTNDRNQVVHQKFLVDTGADVSVLPFSFAKQNYNSSMISTSDIRLKNYDQTEIPVLGEINALKCSFKNKSGSVDFVVCDSNMAILGTDAIFNLNLQISAGKQEVTACSIERENTVPTRFTSQVNPLPAIEGFNFFIKLKENSPDTLIQKARRIPFSLEDQVEKEITKLIQEDIIEEIDDSPYLSPIVVVPKGEGIRLCVDYRKINQHIVVDQHPLPTSEEIFARLSGAKYFSKLDLKSAYHQLIIKEDSRNLTAFTCHLGLFRYKRLPFGLANAPSAYMKVISIILRPCKNSINYLDDILIFGSTQEEHDRCLNDTLEKLKEFNLTINEKKCEFSKTELKFLGRLISSEGVSPLPETIQSVQDAESPHSKQALRSFLGLFNYYRNYVPNAASISAPLYELLKENVPFVWSDELEQVFVSLKQCLLNYMFHSNSSTPIHLFLPTSLLMLQVKGLLQC